MRVASPGDLAGGWGPTDAPDGPGAPAAPFTHLAGRVALRQGDAVWLADALGRVRVELGRSPGAPPEPGDLLVVALAAGSVEGAPGQPLAGTVSWHERHPAPRGDGEAAALGTGRAAALVARARAEGAVRAWFGARGFLEVTTPVAVPSPGLDPHLDALPGADRWLQTSPEFHMKRLLVGGVPRCFQLARCFRADEQGRWHEPEFTLLEWYRAFSGQAEVMADTEALVVAVARAAQGAPEVAAPELTAPDGRRLALCPPFPRLTVREAFRRHAGVDDAVALARDDEARFFELLVERVEPALAAHDAPVFLVDYPLTQASLARPSPTDPTVAERFELWAGGVELCNGFGELTAADEQARRFDADLAWRRAHGRREYPLDTRFLAALREGLPPSGGNALGFERLLALALGAPALERVLAFPRSRDGG